MHCPIRLDFAYLGPRQPVWDACLYIATYVLLVMNARSPDPVFQSSLEPRNPNRPLGHQLLLGFTV